MIVAATSQPFGLCDVFKRLNKMRDLATRVQYRRMNHFPISRHELAVFRIRFAKLK